MFSSARCSSSSPPLKKQINKKQTKKILFLLLLLFLLDSPVASNLSHQCSGCLSFPAATTARDLSGAGSTRYFRAVPALRLQMSSCHVVTWHLEQLLGGWREVVFEVLIKVPSSPERRYIRERRKKIKNKNKSSKSRRQTDGRRTARREGTQRKSEDGRRDSDGQDRETD